MPRDAITYDLPHGIRLTVSDTSGKLTIREVADVLAEAVTHFKRHRDDLKAATYALGDYVRPAARGRKVLGEVRLSAPTAEALSPDQWTAAVIRAYVEANTLEDMREELAAYRTAAGKNGGWLLEVVRLLEQRRDLDALRVALGRGR